MSASLDKLLTLLKEKGELSDDDVQKITAEHGELSPEEHIEFSLARLKKGASTAITMEQYLAASKVLDTAPEGSPEYVAAEKIVEEYEKSSL